MPQLIEYEGRVHEFPDNFSQEDISNALSQVTEPEPLPKTSAFGAGLREAAKSILPSVAGAAGWMGAAELAPATGGLSFLIPAGAALASSALAGAGQRKLAKAVIPGYEQTEQADIQQHPIATRVGGLAGAAAVFEMDPKGAMARLAAIPKVFSKTASPLETKLAQTAGLQLGLGAAGGAVTPLLEGERPTLGGIAESAATSLLFGNPRWKALLPKSMRTAAGSIKGDQDASRQQEATEVYGDVPAQPEQGEGQVPVKEGRERVQPSPGEEGQPGILLRPIAPQKDWKIFRNAGGEGFILTDNTSTTLQFPTLDAAKEALQGITRGTAAQRPTKEPTAEPAAKPAEKTAEDLAYEEHERQALQHAEEIGGKAEVVDKIEPEDPNQPFAGLIATISPKGHIQIDRGEFRDWLKQVPVDKRDMAVRSLVAEEQNHVLTFKTVGEDGAAKFWRNLTEFEKYAHSRRYAGEGYKERLAGMSDAKLGYEAINSFMQRAARMPMREFIESTGRERWTIKTLDELANIVFKVREALGTRASKEQVRILDTIQSNISAAVAAQRDQEQPGAIRRKPDESQEKFLEARIARLQSQVDLANLRKDPDAERAWSARLNDTRAERLLESLARSKVEKIMSGKELKEGGAPGTEPYIVKTSEFMAELKKAGIDHPEGYVEFSNWAKPIADRVLPRWQRTIRSGQMPGAIRRSPKEPEELRTSPMETEGFAGETERKALQEQVDKRGIYVNGKPVSWETLEGKIAEYVFFDGYEHYRRNLVRAIARAQKSLADPNRSEAQKRLPEQNLREFAQEVKVLEKLRNADIRLGPEFPFPGWKNEYQMRLDLPGAIRRGKKDTSTPEMFTALQGISGEKGKEAEQAVAARAVEYKRPAEAEVGTAYKRYEPEDIKAQVVDHLMRTDIPSFRDLMEDIRKQYGPNVPEAPVLTLFDELLGKRLDSAPSKYLEVMRAVMGIGKQVGRGRPERSFMEMRRIPEKDRRTSQQIQDQFLSSELAAGNITHANMSDYVKEAKDVAKRVEAGQKYRARVISEIYIKAMTRATRQDRPWTRTSVSVDDIAYGKDSKQPAFQDIYQHLTKYPRLLGRILTEDSAVDRTGRRAPPVSVTRRITAIQNKNTGEVFLVSTYRDGRRGPVMLDPTSVGEHQLSVDQMLVRFRPVASALLEDPVQNFFQKFKNMADFDESFANEARHRAQAIDTFGPERVGESLEPPLEREATYLEPQEQFEQGGELQRSPLTGEVIRQMTEQSRGTEFVPKSEVTEGEGGGAVGPEAVPMRAAQGLVRGALESRAPITDAEALHILDRVYGDDPIESHLEMRAVVDTLTEKSKQGKLDRSDWRFLNAIRKIADSIQSKNPDFTPEQSITRTLNEVFQAAQSAEGREDFAKTIVGRYAQEAPGPIGPPQQAAVERRVPSPTELTMRQRVPPTVTRPQMLPPGYEAPPRMAPPARPEGTPGEIRPIERLSRRAMADIVAKKAGRPRESLPEVTPIQERKPTGKVTEYTEYGIPEVSQKMPKRRGQLNMPGAIRKDLKARFEVEKRKVVAMVKGRDISRNVYQRMDGMEANGRQAAFFSGSHIRVQSKNPQVREAAIAMIAVEKVGKDGTRNYQDNFIKELISQTRSGIQQAQEWQTRKNPWYWFWGKRWEQSATRWKKAAEYALEHKDDPELLRVVDAFRDEMKSAIEHENANGLNTVERENYAPGYLEGEFWNAGTLRFGGIRGLGGNFGRPKSFKHYFEAISKGPYIPLSYDAADIAQTRVSRGRYLVNRRIWAEAGKEIRVPGTNYPLVTEPAPIFEPYKDPLTGQQVFDPKTGKPVMVPSGAFKEPVVKQMKSLRGDVKGREPVRGEEVRYKLVNLYENSKPIAVHPEYENVFRNALAQSYLRKMPITRDLLWGIQVAKHGSLLILDTFHLGRLWEYAMASATGKTFRNPFRGGLTALQYRPEDLNAAVRNGFVRESDAKWAMEKLEKPIKIRIPYTGKFEMIETNHELGQYLIKNGLNAVGTADALWKDAIKNVPGIGEMWHKAVSPLNRFLFDKLTPGLMMQTAINNFKKYQASHPNVPPADLAADVIRDTNGMYGNMGRQGIFKNPTWRDFAQLFLLAPVWQEGLLQKEVRFMGRLGALPLRAGAAAGIVPEGMVPRRGLPAMGTIGEAMAKGLLAFAAGTQIINLYTKGHFTWENEEEGHKMDAWIPTGDKGRGLWLSPMSVFAELTHDMIRYGETKPTVWDAALQIGENKLGPMGRLAMVLGGRQTSTGEHITSTAGIMKEAGKQMAPLPISLSVGLQKLGSMVGMAKPPTPEQWIQRSLGAFGFKVQTRERNESFVSRMAKDFMKKEGLHKETGWEEVQTDQPGYTKLRSALRLGDERGAVNMLEAIRKTHSDQDIIKAMMAWEKRPFTGNTKAERLWLSGLDEKQLGLYNAALDDRLDVIGKFYELMLAN